MQTLQRTRLWLALVGLLALFAFPTPARAIDGVPDEPVKVELPPELEKLVAANTASLARLRSVEATLDLSVRQRIKGKELAYEDVARIWADGHKVREDREAKPGSRVDTRTVELPGPAPGGGRLVMGPSLLSRLVLSPEEVLAYRPGQEAMSVTPGDADSPYGERVTLLYRFVTVQSGRTLEQQVRKHWAAGFHPKVTAVQLDDKDEVAGENHVDAGTQCQLLEWEFVEAKMASKMWVATGQGSMVRKVQQFYKDRLVGEWHASVKDYGDGLLWIERAKETDWSGDEAEPTKHMDVSVRELKPNAPVDAERFTIKGMGVPTGRSAVQSAAR